MYTSNIAPLETHLSKRLLVTALALTCALAGVRSAQAVTIGEHTALMSLYASTNGNQWVDNSNWGSNNSECTWFGVVCETQGNATFVSEVILPDNNLTGSLPDLTGLNRVHYFDFNNNFIQDSLPSTLGSLLAVDTFNIGNNYLTGQIPPINTMSALQVIVLDENLLVGPIPSLSGMNSLRTFDASDNHLSGSIPTLNTLPQLINFEVERNALSGPLPSLAGMHSLETFKVGSNRLAGVLPPVPSPTNNLLDSSSSLCPNNLVERSDLAWSKATGTFFDQPSTQWYQDIAFPGGFCGDLIFSDGFDPRDRIPL